MKTGSKKLSKILVNKQSLFKKIMYNHPVDIIPEIQE